eukprot:2862121-Rhodomonas_salina.2
MGRRGQVKEEEGREEGGRQGGGTECKIAPVQGTWPQSRQSAWAQGSQATLSSSACTATRMERNEYQSVSEAHVLLRKPGHGRVRAVVFRAGERAIPPAAE